MGTPRVNGGYNNGTQGSGKGSRHSKEARARLRGKPGEIKTVGYSQTKIGADGKASVERHNTNHNKPKVHTNPHDHTITWTDDTPKFGEPVNYQNGNVPSL